MDGHSPNHQKEEKTMNSHHDHYIYDASIREYRNATKTELVQAYDSDRLCWLHGYKDGGTWQSLAILNEDGGWDTRGECYSVWDATWTRNLKSLDEALSFARY